MGLKTFAFFHPLEAARLREFEAAFPDVEFLVPGDAALPAGAARADAGAISWDSPPIDEVLAAAPGLRWLHQRGAGIDRISASPRFVASDLVLTNGSGNHAVNIAEHLMGMMLAFARQLPALVLAQRERRWQPPPARSVFELSGQTLAVVGVGAIGAALAERAAAFDMKVVGVRRTLAPGPMPRGLSAMVTVEQLDDTLRDADHVALTLPLTSETRGLFSTARFAAMKRGAYLYNVGRGGLVDHAALLASIRTGQIGGAGLDVTDPEPLPADSPLWIEPNVLITAHSSGLTPHSFARYRALLLDNMRRYDRGEPLNNVVDKRLGY